MVAIRELLSSDVRERLKQVGNFGDTYRPSLDLCGGSEPLSDLLQQVRRGGELTVPRRVKSASIRVMSQQAANLIP